MTGYRTIFTCVYQEFLVSEVLPREREKLISHRQGLEGEEPLLPELEY